MKFKDGLDPLFGSPTKLRLLRTLLAAPGRRSTGRALAAQARVSTAQAARDLSDFLDVGLVLRDVQGKSYSWHLNEQHVLTSELSRLFDREAHLGDMLAHEVIRLMAGVPIRRVRLFGSVARGDERADSDVDLFLEVRTSGEKPAAVSVLEKVRERVWNRFGNPLTALVYTEAETRKPPNPSLLESIDREGIDLRTEDPGVHGED